MNRKKLYGRDVIRFVRVDRGENPAIHGQLFAVIEDKYKHPMQSQSDRRTSMLCLTRDGVEVMIDTDVVSVVPLVYVVVDEKNNTFHYLWEADNVSPAN